MARGTGRFSPEVLRDLRKAKPVDGRLLSAAALARMIGTSKARILAYEKGTSTPEPARVAELARVFRVPSRELYQPSKGQVTLRDIRSYAGLTAAELAQSIGVSRTTYRDLELSAIVPPRHTSTLLARLAKSVNLPPRMIERALEAHPAAIERRRVIYTLLTEIFDRAHIRHAPAAVSPEEPGVVAIADLLRRPVSMVCRLVNNEMNRLRRLLLNHAIEGQALAFAQTQAMEQQARTRLEQLDDVISRFPRTSANNLDRFSSWALNNSEWRTLVQLTEITYVNVTEEALNDPTEQALWEGLIARDYVATDRVGAGVPRVYVMTMRGLREVQSHHDRYACLYPRVPVPRLRSGRVESRPTRLSPPLPADTGR